MNQAIFIQNLKSQKFIIVIGALLTCPPKTDPHVKLEWWIKGRQGTEPARNAEFVGWADEDTLYLMPETALRVVNEAIRRQGDFLALGRNDMLAALAREGFIEPGKNKTTRLKWIQGTARRVIFMPLSKLGHEGGEVEY